MSDTEYLSVFEKEKAENIELFAAWGLYLRAQQEAPELFSSFNKLLDLEGVTNKNLNDPGFQKVVRQFAKNFAHTLAQEIEQGASPRAPELQKSVVPQELLAEAQQIVSDPETFKIEYRKKFVGRLVDNYAKQLRAQQRSDAVAAAIAEKVRPALEEVSQRSGEANFSREALRVVQTQLPEDQPAINAARQTLEQPMSLDEVHAYYNVEKTHEALQESVVNSPVNHPEIYATVLKKLTLDNPLRPMEELIETATEQTRKLEILTATSVENTETVGGNAAIKTFFQSFAETGAQKTFAPAVDALVSMFGPETQFAVADIMTGKAFKKHLEQVYAVTPPQGSYLGLTREQIGVLKDAATKHVSALEMKHGRSARAKTAILVASYLYGQPNTKTFDEILTLQRDHPQLFQKLTDTARGYIPGEQPAGTHAGALHAAQGSIVVMIERFWITTRDGMIAGMYAKNPTSSHVVFSGPASWIVKHGAGRAMKAATGKAQQWLLKTGFGKLITVMGGTLLGGPIGFIAGLLLGGIAGKLFGKIKGFFGGIGNVIRLGHGGKQRFYEDPSSLGFAMMLVGIPIVLVFFMTFMTTSIITGAFSVTSGRPIDGATQGSSAKIAYSGQDPPASAITTAPAHGALSQTPFMDTGTHKGVDAIDIVVNTGTPVVAAQDGFVVSNGTENGCLWDKDLGNYVRIVGSCGGQECFTTYAHLLSCSSAVTTAIPGDTKKNIPATIVRAGTNIGEADSTGNSTGSHSHTQYNGPGKLEDFFPSIGQKKI